MGFRRLAGGLLCLIFGAGSSAVIQYALDGANSMQAGDRGFAEVAMTRLKCDAGFNTAGPSSHSRTGRFSLLSHFDWTGKDCGDHAQSSAPGKGVARVFRGD